MRWVARWPYVLPVVLVVFVAEAVIMLFVPPAVARGGRVVLALVDAVVLILIITPFVIAIERRRERAEILARRLASVVQNADDAVVGATTDAIITSWNPAAERQTGYTAVEAIGRAGTFVLHPDRQGEVPAQLERLRGGEAVDWETVVVRKDGTTFDAWVTLAPVRDRDGPVTGIALIARDITERVQAQAAQAALVRKLETALQQVKQLSGLLPICANCKRIKGDEGTWTQLEVYVRERSEAEFSHGICPECAAKVYGEWLDA